jgi:ATP-dependent RNA helicase DDX35
MERQFWKPNTVAPGIDIERDAGHDDESGSSSSNSGFLPWNTKQRLSISQQQQMLPIYARKQEILYAIETNPVTILIGETGSGKTTQLPQYLRHAGWCAGGRTVVCTQPRRVAAVSVAARVAEECKSKMGHGVGYAVRFDRNMDKGPTPTQLQFVTDGLLLRMLISDPLLQRYSVVIVDEAHERSLATDLLLGLLKKVQAVRRDLRIVISSATLDYASFRTYFTLKKGRFSTPPGVVMVQGRQHVTTNHYLEAPCKDYLRAAIESVDHLHRSQKKKNGDILVFLTGKQQVEDAVRLCGELGHRDLLPLCLYSGLPASAQVRVFQFDKNQASRKVVFSTNVAEASVTIPNIGFVVDCGFVKHKFYDPETGVDSLEVVPISQASARQRAGRAGRVAEGHCFRLYPESTLTSMMPQSHQPELQRSNLARLVLQMKSLAVDDLMGFDFISPPSLELLADAMEQLFAAGAVDEDGKLTSPVGTMLASFPLSPALGRMVLCASDLKCTEEVLTIVAMLTVQNVLIIPSQHNTRARKAHAEFSVIQGDMLTYLNIYNNFLANNKEHQWCRDNFLHHGALKRAGMNE